MYFNYSNKVDKKFDALGFLGDCPVLEQNYFGQLFRLTKWLVWFDSTVKLRCPNLDFPLLFKSKDWVTSQRIMGEVSKGKTKTPTPFLLMKSGSGPEVRSDIGDSHEAAWLIHKRGPQWVENVVQGFVTCSSLVTSFLSFVLVSGSSLQMVKAVFILYNINLLLKFNLWRKIWAYFSTVIMLFSRNWIVIPHKSIQSGEVRGPSEPSLVKACQFL